MKVLVAYAFAILGFYALWSIGDWQLPVGIMLIMTANCLWHE